MTPSGPATLFGLPLALERNDAEALRSVLTEAFAAQYHRLPEDLDGDLRAMSSLAPGVRAEKPRSLAMSARPIDAPRDGVPTDLLQPVSATRALLLPEGRVVLELLLLDAGQAGRVVFGRDELLFALARIAEFYGAAQRAWIAQQIRGGDLRPGSLGFAILLLINDTVGADRALQFPGDTPSAVGLLQRLAVAVDAFAEGIGGSKLNEDQVARGPQSLWALTELPRQLLGPVVRDDSGYWIDERERDALVERLARVLATRTRTRIDLDRLASAFDETAARYVDTARPALAARKLAFGRSDRIRALRHDLLTAFAETRAVV